MVGSEINPHSYQPVKGLAYLFLDFNAYFASVEQHDRPELVGRPVIVTPLRSEYTGAIAVSYEAKEFGIKRGTKVRDARALCPDIVVLPARHDRYVELHKLWKAEVERHLPIAKIYSIDEAALYLSKSERTPAAACEVAHRIIRGLAQNVGPALKVSIGLAPSRLLAKLAAERMKPDGLTVLELSDLPGKLANIPLRDVPGIGAGIADRLERAGISDFIALWNLEPKRARAIWHSVAGERFWYGLHGYDIIEAPTVKSNIGHSRVVSGDYQRPDQARLVARALLLKAASRLRHYGMHAGGLSLSLRLRPEGQWDRGLHFSPSQDSFHILHSLDSLWGEYSSHRGREAEKVRIGSVAICLHRLREPGDTSMCQPDLFADKECLKAGIKKEKLWRAIDQVNADSDAKFRLLGGEKGAKPTRKYISLASQSNIDLNYLGVKIAFSRVPEESEFLY